MPPLKPADEVAQRLMPKAGTVVVRLYRIGHGDCFLLAFGRDADGPLYILIDCGYKPGSPKFLSTTAAEVGESLKQATGGHIHVVAVTHEHQDHVNGFTVSNFAGITVGQCWFAWTEDGDDPLANALRKRFKDRLHLLTVARNALAAAGGDGAVQRIDDFIAFEIGGESETISQADLSNVLAAGEATLSANKRAMKLVRDLSQDDPVYLRPHTPPRRLDGLPDMRVYTLGPPEDEKLLHSLNPQAGEGYRDDQAFALSSRWGFFGAAVRGRSEVQASDSPFAPRFRIPWNDALATTAPIDFWREHYSGEVSSGTESSKLNPGWRRIDADWLFSAEDLALDMNNDTNNGSLVLAFELSPGGKVLLFAADAQRGNWISWSRGTWKDGEREVTAKELLARTVLYKVGHHGSHNATLKGELSSDYANLDWMGHGEHADEFTAMITAVRPWAETQKGWDHPLAAIKDALLGKAKGRVFQTDTDVEKMAPQGPARAWKNFQASVRGETLFIDYTIPIE